MSRSLIITFILCALAVPAFAQTTGVPGTNDLVINGAGSGATSMYYNPAPYGGIIDFAVSSIPSALLVGVFSPNAAPGFFPLVSGTSVDIDLNTSFLFVDGVNPNLGYPVSNVVPASGTWQLTAPIAIPAGAPYNFQFGIFDASFAGGIATTQAHTSVSSAIITTSYTISDDGSVTHALAPTNAISFYGTSYSSINIASNGYLTFVTASSDFTETMPEFFAGFQPAPTLMGSANPGVAVCYTDLNRGGTTSGATYDVIENTITGTTSVQFLNQNWWSTVGTPAGNFSCNFTGLGGFQLDYTGFVPSVGSTDNFIIGVTNGDDQSGTSTDLSDGLGTGFSTAIPFMSAAPNDSVGELFPADSTPPAALSFIDMGGGAWSIF